jgi:hypothetical protein
MQIMKGGPGFTSSDFTRASVKIRDSGKPATSTELARLLGLSYHGVNESEGRAILLALVQHNALHVRQYSTMAKDIPMDMYGWRQEEEIVTMATPLDDYCVTEWIKKQYANVYHSAGETFNTRKSATHLHFVNSQSPQHRQHYYEQSTQQQCWWLVR